METRELSKQQADNTRLREIRRKLAAGEMTPEEAAEQGFPPADPIEETR